MKKNKIFVACDTTNIKKIKEIINKTQSSKIKVVITKKIFKGAEIMYSLKFGNSLEILGLFPSHLNFDVGEQIGVKLEVDHLVAFRSLDDYDERVI